MKPPIRLEDMTETQWDALVFRGPKSIAKQCGWTSYHVLRSRGSAPGYPDRTAWRDRLVLAELKTEKGKISDRQVDVLSGLAKAGAEVYLWRPNDLDEIGHVMAGRWTWDPVARLLVGDDRRSWLPGSLWLPAGQRADET